MDNSIGTHVTAKENIKIQEDMVALSGAAALAFYESSLSPSQQSAKNEPISAAFPKLEKSADWRPEAVPLKMQELISMMLDQWSKSLQEIQEWAEAARNSPSHLAWLERNSPAELARQLEKLVTVPGEWTFTPSSNQGVDAASRVSANTKIDPNQLDNHNALWLEGVSILSSLAIPLVEKMKETSAIQGRAERDSNVTAKEASDGAAFHAQQLMTSSFLVAGALLFTTLSAVSSTVHTQTMAMNDAWGAILPGEKDIASIFGAWFSSLWNVTLINQLSAEKIKEYGPEKDKLGKHTIDFAKTYAERIATTINSSAFSQAIMAVINRFPLSPVDGKPQDPALFLAKCQLIVVSMALALLVKVEEGKIMELNFSGLLTGETDLTINDPNQTASTKRLLIDQIKNLLKQLPVKERETLLENLLAYMATNPDVEEMLDQQAVFNKVFNAESFDIKTTIETAA